MAQSHIDPKIVDRLRKLLALAKDGGANTNEAGLAMDHANRIMAEYNLTSATLEAAGGKADDARIKERNDQSLLYVWKRELLETIAKANFCFLNILTKYNTNRDARIKVPSGYEIIGRESNVVATKNMFEYLLQTIERLIVAEVGTDPSARYNKHSHNFRLGASAELRTMLVQRYERMLAEQAREAREAKARNAHPASATSNALVIVLADYANDEEDANTDLRRGLEPGTTKAARLAEVARYAARKAEREALIARLKAEHPDEDPNVWDWMGYGYSFEAARELNRPKPTVSAVSKPAKPETEAQRRKREAKEERDERRNGEYWERHRRQEAHKHSLGYLRGQQQARTVRLDDQIDTDEQGKLT